MLQQLIEFCTSNASLVWLVVGSDLAIALAYFSIPATMAILLRDRREDIAYPWLWILFVAFILACGLTHVGHVISAALGAQLLGLHAVVGIVTAIASVGTAIAFGLILPQIKLLPSPRRQQRELERLVAERTREKDHLIREINHRIGNQLQIISSLVSIETRSATADESQAILDRLKGEIYKMAAQHLELSGDDYLVSRGVKGPTNDNDCTAASSKNGESH